MSTSLAGSTIGRFRVDRLLGKGGMGAVYAAFDEKLEREVALKVLLEDGESPIQRKRLLREARIAAKLQHPNIATVYEVDELEEKLFIVMELLEGTSLRKGLSDRRFGIEEAIAVARDMARGLARAHAAGVVHRDIKPENVFLTQLSADTTLAKVLDFGLARVKAPQTPEQARLEHTSTDTTSRGEMWGTPGYVSPEQALGQQVDARTDVFSFGVVFYEMLANIRPFRGETAIATMLATTRTEPRSLFEIVPDMPHEIGEIVERCLRKRKEDRYQDAAELSAELESFARSGVSLRLPSIGSARGSRPSHPSHPALASGKGDAPTTGSAAISMSTRQENLLAQEQYRKDRIKLFVAVTIGAVLALVALVLVVTTLSSSKKPLVTAVEAASPPPSAITFEEPAPTPAPTLDPPPEPEPSATPTVVAMPAPHPHPAPAPAPVSSAKKNKPVDCSNPFTVDSKGIRIPKIECLQKR